MPWWFTWKFLVLCMWVVFYEELTTNGICSILWIAQNIKITHRLNRVYTTLVLYSSVQEIKWSYWFTDHRDPCFGKAWKWRLSPRLAQSRFLLLSCCLVFVTSCVWSCIKIKLILSLSCSFMFTVNEYVDEIKSCRNINLNNVIKIYFAIWPTFQPNAMTALNCGWCWCSESQNWNVRFSRPLHFFTLRAGQIFTVLSFSLILKKKNKFNFRIIYMLYGSNGNVNNCWMSSEKWSRCRVIK